MRPDSKTAVISVDGLSVRYRTSKESRPTLKSAMLHLGRRQRTTQIIDALDDVSFTVPRGQVLGIVGDNGAGKSTLLRAIAGILPPTEGRIEVHGRVTTLLSLGVGFNRELSGRENVLLGGLASGLSPEEIADRFGEIEAFADIGDAIDRPMRTYSAGMFGRLGFSVASHLAPRILLIDEAISAGDADFRERCAEKMAGLTTDDEVTILIVSHGLGFIRDLADECLWLNHGQVMTRGESKSVISEYLEARQVAVSDRAYDQE